MLKFILSVTTSLTMQHWTKDGWVNWMLYFTFRLSVKTVPWNILFSIMILLTGKQDSKIPEILHLAFSPSLRLKNNHRFSETTIGSDLQKEHHNFARSTNVYSTKLVFSKLSLISCRMQTNRPFSEKPFWHVISKKCTRIGLVTKLYVP